MTDHEILSTLIGQVSRARPKHGSEMNVITLISRSMWRLWNEATDCNPDDEPMNWTHDPKQCRRVYGSYTVVVESEAFFAVSFATTGPHFMKPQQRPRKK